MLIISHVIIALTSLVVTTSQAIFPSAKRKLLSYSLISLTILTGSGLIIFDHAPILQTCISGLVYLAVALSGVLVGSYRLARKS